MAENRYKRAEKVFLISLGARYREFESPISDQKPSEINDFRGIFLFFVAAQGMRDSLTTLFESLNN